MITAGIDVGLESIKIAIVKDGSVVGKSSGLSGGAGRPDAIHALWEEALENAGVSAGDVENTVATGAGKFDVGFASRNVTEPIADARAARFYLADARAVVDVGADQTRVITLGEDGKAAEIVLNQKCSAGIGTILKYIARRLEMTLDEISALAPGAAKDTVVNDGCIVFAELDALELLNENVPKEEVAAAVTEAMAVRANMILNDKHAPAKSGTVLIGGVAGNVAFANALKTRSGIDFVIPKDAEFGGAVGAALVAVDWRRDGGRDAI
jgi:benzoyl-CoA reductase subunit D